jgi:hypothetical protein
MSTVAKTVGSAIAGVLELLPNETVKKAADAVLDIVEDAIENSETQIDNALATPLINKIRSAFDVPDNDTRTETQV